MNQNLNSQEDKTMLIKFLGLIGILLVCMLLGNLTLLGIAALGGMELSTNMDIFSSISDPELKPYVKSGIGVNHLIMFSLSAMWFAFWMKGKNWNNYFNWAKVDSDLLTKFILLLILSMPIIGASAMALEGVDLPSWADNMDEASIDSLMQMLQMDGVLDLVINLIIIALIPAIGEEFLFRGVIQNELVKKMQNPHLAILLASVIFSAFHLQVQGFLPKLIIGLILGYSYYWTKSLWYPMVLHLINNGMQTVLLFFAGEQLDSMDDETLKPEILPLAIGIIISCFLCYLLVKNILANINKEAK